MKDEMLPSVTKEHVEEYLDQVKKYVREGKSRIHMNRPENKELFDTYVINEAEAKAVLLELEVSNYSHVLKNDNPRFPDEILYVFGKEISLLERYSEVGEQILELYIKINKLDDKPIAVEFVSLHKAKYKLNYPFK
jgi:hypothetical protein